VGNASAQCSAVQASILLFPHLLSIGVDPCETGLLRCKVCIQSLEMLCQAVLCYSSLLVDVVLEGGEGLLGSTVHALGGAHYILEDLVRACGGLFDSLSCFLESHVDIIHEGGNL
jgi:hypothetical protein